MKHSMVKQLLIVCSVIIAAATATVIVVTRSSAIRSGATPHVSAVAVGARSSANPTNIPLDKLDAMGLVPDQISQVGAFSTNGKSHDVYLGPMTNGMMCLIEDETVGATPDGRPLRVYGRACSPGFLKDHAVVVSVSGAGGGSSPRAAEAIVGIARPDVARVVIEDSQGGAHEVQLNANHAFSFELPSQLANSGVQFAAVVAYSSAAAELERRPLEKGTR